jgi:3-hydroxyacyl-[acyl-carrier-protein] dehydratase
MIAVPLEIAREHPAYEGHFPGHPILPAVVLLGEALALLSRTNGTRATDWTLSQAKFPRGVMPGTPLTIAHEGLDGDAIRFEVRSAEGIVASGVFARATAAA